MKYTLISEKDFEMMKNRFDRFFDEITELCVPKQIDQGWMDSQEVCLLLHISKRTLNSYKLKEILPSSRMGNKTFFKITDIQKLIDISKIK
ncbi:MAG: helix-turn-helix domain-containing protein [Rikenellaceae bacterium]|nr:helix-turn-helix domain-containing protein [Rikenellaceae bacterium]